MATTGRRSTRKRLPKVGSREPNLEARRLLVASCDETRFGVRGANDLDDEFGITYGDRVGVYIEGNCVDVIETTTRDGRRERAAVIEAYDGRVLRIIDEAVFRRRRRRRRRAAS